MADGTIFSLEGLGLKLDTAAEIEEHIKPLVAHPTTITTLHLQGNTIGVDASSALARHLSTLTSLTTANLGDIFTARLLSEIPPALSSLLTALLPLKNLHTLNLSDNAFGLNTQAPLVAFLKQHTPLQTLILTNNGLGPEAGTNIADALTELAAAQAKAGMPHLKTVVCGRNRLENGSMPAWAQALAAHADSLEEVRMVQNGIRQEGVSVLLREGLRSAKKLEVLDLQDNTFSLQGSRALAEVMTGWAELKELGVGDCWLTARGWVVLANRVGEGRNKKLEVLRLQYNGVDAGGVAVLAEFVGGRAGDPLPKLRRVELNGNKFDEEDPALGRLRDALDKRREKEGPDFQEGVDENWGIDDLSDLEEDDSDEDEEDEAADDEDVGLKQRAESIVKQADEAEGENVPEEKDDDVDKLADRLGKTEV